MVSESVIISLSRSLFSHGISLLDSRDSSFDCAKVIDCAQKSANSVAWETKNRKPIQSTPSNLYHSVEAKRYELLGYELSGKSKLECLRISVITEPCQLIMEAYTG